MPLDQSLALLCTTPGDGEPIPLVLHLYGALKHCPTCGVRGVLLVTELGASWEHHSFICSSPVLLCLVLCHIVPVGQCCAQGEQGLRHFSYRNPCASLTARVTVPFPSSLDSNAACAHLHHQFYQTLLDLEMNYSAPKFPCFVFQSEPCQNGGRCIVTWNDFHCSCPANFTGKFCEEKVWCESAPCPEATTCVDVVAGYVCKFCSPACVLVKSPCSLCLISISSLCCCKQYKHMLQEGHRVVPRYTLLRAAQTLWACPRCDRAQLRSKNCCLRAGYCYRRCSSKQEEL